MKRILKIGVVLFGLISLNSYAQKQIGNDIEGYWRLGLGAATCLSEDGNTVAVGCWASGRYNLAEAARRNIGVHGNNGQVRVYTKKTSSVAGVHWEQVGDFILAETNIAGLGDGEEFGRDLSLSDDGTILAIGASGNDGAGINTGHVRVYGKLKDTSSPGGFKWQQIGNDIDGTQENSFSGFSVSLSGNGNVVAIGAQGFDINNDLEDAGQVSVYKRSADNNWVQIGDAIKGQSKTEHFGISVSISQNGNILAIAGLNLGDNLGREYKTKGLVTRVYENRNNNWVQIGDFISNDFIINDVISNEGVVHVNNKNKRGQIRLTSSGNTLAINSVADETVRVYTRDTNNNWSLRGNVLKEEGIESIALSDDANTLIVGKAFARINNMGSAGSVHVYKYNPDNTNGNWQMVEVSDDYFAGEHVGHRLGGDNSLSVSPDGTVIALGARFYGIERRVSSRDRDGDGELDISFPQIFKGRIRMFNIGISDVNIEGAPVTVSSTDAFGVTFKFDKSVTGFSEEDIVITNAFVTDFEAVDALTYTANIVPTSICSNDDDITISVAEGAALNVDSGLPNLAPKEVVVKTAPGPVAVAKNIIVQLEANGEVTISPEDIDNGSFFSCSTVAGGIALSLDRDTFTCADVGAPVEVELSATSGTLTATATAMVTVENTVNNLVAVAQDITVQLDTNGEVTILPEDIDNGSNFNCSGVASTITLSLNQDTFTCADVGAPVEVELTATSGTLTASTTAMVTVENTVNSLIAVAQDITVELDTNGEVTILPEDIDNGSNFNCSGVASAITLSLNQDTFTCADIGTPVEVELTATSGTLTASTTAMVTVENTVNSLVAVAQDITVELDTNGEVTILPEDIDNGSNFNCSGVGSAITLSLNQDTFTCADIGTPVEVELTATSGALTAIATAMVTVKDANNCKSGGLVNVNSGFSPNGDGIADTLEIKGLEKFKNNVVKIYNLSQRLLFSGHYNGPSNAWNGTHRGKRVPVGSYVCVIDFNESHIANEVKMIYVNY